MPNATDVVSYPKGRMWIGTPGTYWLASPERELFLKWFPNDRAARDYARKHNLNVGANCTPEYQPKDTWNLYVMPGHAIPRAEVD